MRDLEVLTIGSDPIDKTSEAADKEKAADTAAELSVCPLGGYSFDDMLLRVTCI